MHRCALKSIVISAIICISGHFPLGNQRLGGVYLPSLTMASSSTDLPEAAPLPPPPAAAAAAPATASEQQQQPSTQDQLQSAAAASPDLQQQTSNTSNGSNSNSNSNSNDPFQCLWQGCRERTQSAEALYVCDSISSFSGSSDFCLGPRLRSSHRSQKHKQSELEVWMGELQHLRGQA